MVSSSTLKDPLEALRTSRASERAIAHLIDLLVILAIQIPFFILISLEISFGGLLRYILILSIAPMILLLYFTLLEGFTSTTVGKKVLGLRVISLRSMQGPSLAESFLRNLFRLSDMLTLYSSILILRGGRRLGDVLAGTVVVSRDFLRVEIPRGESPLSRELREAISRATLLELRDRSWRFEWRPIKSTIRDLVADTLRDQDESSVDMVAYLISNPSLQFDLLGTEGIARIYERAAEFCDGGCGEILRSRAAITRAFSHRGIVRIGSVSSVFKNAPSEFRRSIGYFAASLLVFTVSSLSAYYLRPEWVMEALRELFGEEALPSGTSPLTLTCIVFLNNLRVVLVTLGMAPLAFMPFLTLAANGVLVGLVSSLYGTSRVALLVLPHGIPELTSIFIFTSISLRIFRQLLRKEARWSHARDVAIGSVNLASFSVLLLLYAAIVEGFLTVQLSNYPTLDIAFSTAEALVIYSYLLLPRFRPSRGS